MKQSDPFTSLKRDNLSYHAPYNCLALLPFNFENIFMLACKLTYHMTELFEFSSHLNYNFGGLHILIFMVCKCRRLLMQT